MLLHSTYHGKDNKTKKAVYLFQQMPGYSRKQKSLGFQFGLFLICNQFTMKRAEVLIFLTLKVLLYNSVMISKMSKRLSYESQSYVNNFSCQKSENFGFCQSELISNQNETRLETQ